jgi:hypothetical protein
VLVGDLLGMKRWFSRPQTSLLNDLGDEKVPLLRRCMPWVLRGETDPLKGRRRGWLFWGADMSMTGHKQDLEGKAASGYESRRLAGFAGREKPLGPMARSVP